MTLRSDSWSCPRLLEAGLLEGSKETGPPCTPCCLSPTPRATQHRSLHSIPPQRLGVASTPFLNYGNPFTHEDVSPTTLCPRVSVPVRSTGGQGWPKATLNSKALLGPPCFLAVSAGIKGKGALPREMLSIPPTSDAGGVCVCGLLSSRPHPVSSVSSAG